THISLDARLVVPIQVGEGFPSAAKPGDFGADRIAAIDNSLDDRIQAGNVAATGENADSFRTHECSRRKVEPPLYGSPSSPDISGARDPESRCKESSYQRGSLCRSPPPRVPPPPKRLPPPPEGRASRGRASFTVRLRPPS